MKITGNVAKLSEAEQRALGTHEPVTFVERLKCSEALTGASEARDALRRGEEPMAYVPAEILETGMVSRGILLVTAQRRLNILTDMATQVLIHQTECYLQAQANGTAIEDF